MVDTVSLSTNHNNLNACIELALEYGLGIELMTFAFPDVLDGDWEDLVLLYQKLLAPIEGVLSLHGPFMDMVSGSPDALINQVCIGRYQHAIRIASQLGADRIVFHANFIGSIHNPEYRIGWHQRNLDFWGPLAEYARRYDVTITLENMWEFDPDIIGDILREIDHPNLKACLDVGHAYLFSNDNVELDEWFNVLQPWLIHTHMNNNNGVLDEHHAFDWQYGVLDYNDILPKLRALPQPPVFVLEMYEVEDMRRSLPFLELEKRPSTQQR